MPHTSVIPEHSLIVSCQADAGSPFNAPHFIRAFAQAAVRSGAAGLRLEGVANLAAVRGDTNLPIIGLIKRRVAGSEVYITPDLSDVIALDAAGADLIAFDATLRERPVSVERLVQEIHARSRLALADISSVAEAEAALAAGADFVSTTLSGYTSYSPKQDGPDLKLIADLAAIGVRPLAEGRIRNPDEAREALRCGAYAVVVGSAITRPEVIAASFVAALGGKNP